MRPKLVKSVHFCPTTKKTMERRYTDMTDLEAFPSTGIYPNKDEDGNLLETEFGLSQYKNHQIFTVQASFTVYLVFIVYHLQFCVSFSFTGNAREGSCRPIASRSGNHRRS